MADLDELQNLLVDSLFGEFSEENGRKYAFLKETGIDASLKTVKIFDVPADSVLLKLDEYQQPHTLFKNDKGQRCRCDYVLLTKIGTAKYMIFVEMKSKNVTAGEVIKQFKGAECVIDYCESTLNRFHGQTDLLKQYNKRFVLFYKASLSKTTTRLKVNSTKNNSPESALKFPNPQNPSIKSLVIA